VRVNWGGWLLWGFASTVVLTSILSASQGTGITRMNLPYLLGTMFTPNRDRAKLLGSIMHMVNGWIFSLIYVAAFHAWNGASWWRGALVGIVHAIFVLTVLMAMLPSLHPRMANEQQGPDVVRQLEPPGFLALHYGIRTPLSVIISHVIFGGILGYFYHFV
jgi:hypothetical protein